MNDPAPSRWLLGEILIEKGWLHWKQLDQALEVQKKSGLLIGEALLNNQSMTEEKIFQALAIQHQMPFVDLNHFTIKIDTYQILPLSFIREHQVLPIAREQNTLLVAVSHPGRRLLASLVCSMAKVSKVEMVIAGPQAIQKMIDNYYGVKKAA